MDIGELALEAVLELNHQDVLLVESGEAAEPILEGQECLLVWVQLSKYLLQELGGEIEAFEGVVLRDEGLKLLKINSICLV